MTVYISKARIRYQFTYVAHVLDRLFLKVVVLYPHAPALVDVVNHLGSCLNHNWLSNCGY